MTIKIVITRATGSGKSTLLRNLSNAGFYVMKEVAEFTKESELRKKVSERILPETNRDAFQKKVFETQMRWEAEIPTRIPISFQDRGIPDGIAFYLADGLNPPERLVEAAREARYDQVLILEPNPDYKNTRIRTESREKSLAVHENLWKVYQALGYRPIRMPLESENERFWRTIQILDSKYGITEAPKVEEELVELLVAPA
jgi:predicted ATPase